MLHSYAVYEKISFVLPLTFILLSLCLAIAIFLVLWHYSRRKHEDYIWLASYELLSITYGDKLQKHCYEDGKLMRISLHGYNLNHVVLASLDFAVILVYICAFATFFSKLLITETTDQCNIHMDCFALNATTSLRRPVQQGALQENCSEYLTNSSYIVLCYRLSFNYISAIGSTGGILIVGNFVLKTQAALVSGFQHQYLRGKYTVIHIGLVAFVIVEAIFLALMYLNFFFFWD